MATEKQLIAILTVAGAFVGLGFAIYNLYEQFKPNNNTTTTVARTAR